MYKNKPSGFFPQAQQQGVFTIVTNCSPISSCIFNFQNLHERIFSIMIQKYLFTLLLNALILNSAYSQELVKIGLNDEKIYSFEQNNSNLYFDFFASKSNFNEVKIVGMGEATHGTKEFFNLKKETFKYLALNCHYRVFGIEASFGGCNYINDYVNSGIGNIDSAMHNLEFWTWQTEEVKDLILWIKDFNADKAQNEKIIFFGFDMQNYYSPIEYINTFLSRRKIDNYHELQEIIKPITSYSELALYYKLQDKKLHYSDTLLKVNYSLNVWLKKNKAKIESTYSEKQFETLQFCVENFHEAINMSQSAGYNYRDSCMAATIIKIQQQEDAKVFIWAHNGHINLSMNNTLMNPMGAYLKKHYDQKYYSIGFVFSEGRFQAFKGPDTFFGVLVKYVFARKKLYKGLIECSVPTYKKNTLTNYFERTGKPSFFIDLTKTENAVFTTPKHTYDIGAAFLNYKRSSDKIIASKQFNGLIYFNHTSSATPYKKRMSAEEK